MKKVYIITLILIFFVVTYFLVINLKKSTPISISSNNPTTTTISPTQNSTISAIPTANKTLVEPVTNFKSRITKKPFGIYITLENSPVQPENFTGYHTGIDVEYEDITDNVPIIAVANGKIVYSGFVSGYGGTIIEEIDLDGSKHNILYGHLRPDSLPTVGTTVKQGNQIAILGTGYTRETDNERKHLHFAILSNNRIDLKGYVQNQLDLQNWLNPLDFY